MKNIIVKKMKMYSYTYLASMTLVLSFLGTPSNFSLQATEEAAPPAMAEGTDELQSTQEELENLKKRIKNGVIIACLGGGTAVIVGVSGAIFSHKKQKKKSQKKINHLQFSHEQHVENLNNAHEKNVKDLNDSYNDEVETLIHSHTEEMQNLKSSYEESLNALQKQLQEEKRKRKINNQKIKHLEFSLDEETRNVILCQATIKNLNFYLEEIEDKRKKDEKKSAFHFKQIEKQKKHLENCLAQKEKAQESYQEIINFLEANLKEEDAKKRKYKARIKELEDELNNQTLIKDKYKTRIKYLEDTLEEEQKRNNEEREK